MATSPNRFGLCQTVRLEMELSGAFLRCRSAAALGRLPVLRVGAVLKPARTGGAGVAGNRQK
jgi:hypothetical protein